MPGDEHTKSWYRIVNVAPDSPADLYIYDEIGGWGITASDFVKDLRAIKAKEINLHLNTPGGLVHDGIAIHNALKQHPAKVNVTVDALAASIGSVIAMAGDDIAMARRSTMMIHEAQGGCMGNAQDMAKMVEVLDQMSDNIAGIYSDRAGGTPAEWRARMKTETWLKDEDAVALGLADRILDQPAIRNSFDLAKFGYQHIPRNLAPTPDPKNEMMWVETEPMCIVPACACPPVLSIPICRDHLAALFELDEGEPDEAQEMAEHEHVVHIQVDEPEDEDVANDVTVTLTAEQRVWLTEQLTAQIVDADAGDDGCCDDSGCANCGGCGDCDNCEDGGGCECAGCPAQARAQILLILNGAMPVHRTAKAAEDATWDGPAEVAKAKGAAELKRMHAWFKTGGDPEKKGDYKLPHHDVDGEVVWAGVRAAYQRLGQTQIPAGDKAGVEKHLQAHAKQFGKTLGESESADASPFEIESFASLFTGGLALAETEGKE